MLHTLVLASALVALSAAQMPSAKCTAILQDGIGQSCMTTLMMLGIGGTVDVDVVCSGDVKSCMKRAVDLVPKLAKDCFGQLPPDVPMDLLNQIPAIYQDIIDQGICVKSPSGNYCGGHLTIDTSDPNPDKDAVLTTMCNFWMANPCCFSQIQAVEQGLYNNFAQLLNASGNVPRLPDLGNQTASMICKAVKLKVPAAAACKPVHIRGPGSKGGTPVWVFAAAGAGGLVLLIVLALGVRTCVASNRKTGYSIQADLA